MWRRLLFRGVAFALAALVCWWLTRQHGPWIAWAIWTAAMAVLCAVVAFLMSRQPMGKVGIINYAAGVVLQWGYKIGKGKLVPIAVTSAIVWALMGAAAIALSYRPMTFAGVGSAGQSEGSHPVLRTLLIISWIIDGAALLYTINVMAAASRRVRSLINLTLILTLMIVVSVALTVFGNSVATTALALAIAGGPPLLVGGGYGLFLLVMLTAGRNARWN